ncbi:GNAT family N-acetyltransferase [Salipaludibacillus sp. LMS25]|jgi:RimJ/RimL family protein N-acetyltransferase|uniref:GNAT family N-acetyltransferase n=1 Tax=Salipaludibacillus sp. LMS25 TaxID=2924031 RepID=UPI0020D16B2E|nr:GNAT family N-acetyltransferase [Salipaludibacillus sp. LMS25]UTR16433.1 GNAT family N-acetyltransferase [Salipaludibacillus sp. LMS25]
MIETTRLMIWPFEEDDLPALYAILSDKDTMTYYPSSFNVAKTRSWIERNQQRFVDDGFGLWAVVLKRTDEVIGDCDLVLQTVEGTKEVEIGYHISNHYWGKGYATEATTASQHYGFSTLKLSRLISIIDPANISSVRVAERTGLTFENEAYMFHKWQYIRYSHLRGNSSLISLITVW